MCIRDRHGGDKDDISHSCLVFILSLRDLPGMITVVCGLEMSVSGVEVNI